MNGFRRFIAGFITLLAARFSLLKAHTAERSHGLRAEHASTAEG